MHSHTDTYLGKKTEKRKEKKKEREEDTNITIVSMWRIIGDRWKQGEYWEDTNLKPVVDSDEDEGMNLWIALELQLTWFTDRLDMEWWKD